MKNIFYKAVILVAVAVNFSIFASETDPVPPMENPHPPVTEQDKRRVAFAEKAILALLKPAKQGDSTLKDFTDRFDTHSYVVDEKCLDDFNCIAAQTELVSYLNTLKFMHGQAFEIKHAHIIPWSWEKYLKDNGRTTSSIPNPTQSGKDGGMSKMVFGDSSKGLADEEPPPAPLEQRKNEFIIHAYGDFTNGGWKNVDVFVSENVQGKLIFRRFFIMNMYQPHHTYPPGTVC